MFFRKNEIKNPIERYLREVRLSSMLNGYGLANGLPVDPYVSKEILKEEMRRVEEYLAAKEDMNYTRKLR